jgi:hypothetical protein
MSSLIVREPFSQVLVIAGYRVVKNLRIDSGPDGIGQRLGAIGSHVVRAIFTTP